MDVGFINNLVGFISIGVILWKYIEIKAKKDLQNQICVAYAG